MVDGGDESIDVPDFGQPQYFIDLIVDLQVKLSVLVQEHLVGFAHGVKILALCEVYKIV